MRGDKIKGQVPIKLNEWNRKRGNDRNVIPFHNYKIYFLSYSSALLDIMSQPKTVQKYLGHATLQMTMDLYTSVMPKHLSNEIDKLDNELEKLSESGEEIIDSRYKQEKKNSIITFPGDSLVV